MQVEDALAVLGASRVIWIDDCFNVDEQLVDLIVDNLEAGKKSKNTALVGLLESYEFSFDKGPIDQFLRDCSAEDVANIRQELLNNEAKQQRMPTADLSNENIEVACRMMGVDESDRWTFKDAKDRLEEVCKGGDSEISYVVDLNHAGVFAREGREVITKLKNLGSKGTAFILTHETDARGEESLEIDLRNEISNGGDSDVPICVIAKQRIKDADDEGQIAEALRIAIKRAGLRRSIQEVLAKAKSEISVAFGSASQMLLEIPPEHLDKFVVERGYAEGLSEMHVVERALTAKISDCLRGLFASNEDVKKSTERLRNLRKVELALQPTIKPHANLDAFRSLEVWENADLINGSHAPLSCGDVFETDPFDKNPQSPTRRYLLLGQPCDVSIRATKDRQLDIAYLVPLKKKGTGPLKAKEALLQFKLDDDQWICDFRDSSPVQLRILDLACLRSDGRVRVDEGQTVQPGMLAGLQRIATGRLAVGLKVIAALNKFGPVETFATQLSYKTESAFFKPIYQAKLCAAAGAANDRPALPKRLTWGLLRMGRVKLPYATALLRDYLSLVGRDAFDLDYTKGDGPDESQGSGSVGACSSPQGPGDNEAVPDKVSPDLADQHPSSPQDNGMRPHLVSTEKTEYFAEDANPSAMEIKSSVSGTAGEGDLMK